MKYTKPRTVYGCANCGRQTVVLHEIISGRGNRTICIENNVQAPLCIECHRKAHGSTGQEEFAISISKSLGIDYWMAFRAVKNKRDRGYLYVMRDEFKKNIKKLEIY